MLNYKMVSYQIKTTDGLDWVAEYPALSGVVGTGSTLQKAIEDLTANAEVHIKVMKELGIEIPKEDSIFVLPQFSGRITVRTQKITHEKISDLANKEGVSLNQWINDAILYKLGYQSASSDFSEKIQNYVKELSNITELNVNLARKLLVRYNTVKFSKDGYIEPKEIKYTNDMSKC